MNGVALERLPRLLAASTPPRGNFAVLAERPNRVDEAQKEKEHG